MRKPVASLAPLSSSLEEKKEIIPVLASSNEAELNELVSLFVDKLLIKEIFSLNARVGELLKAQKRGFLPPSWLAVGLDFKIDRSKR